MDVISLGKANKAKKKMKALADRLGDGVQDIEKDVKTRLEKLEQKKPHLTLATMVSRMEENISINIHKHNLRVSTILNAQRYKMTNLIVEDFKDESGIDLLSSNNLTYDAAHRLYKQTNLSLEASIVLKKEDLIQAPRQFLLSASFSGSPDKSIPVNLADSKATTTNVSYDPISGNLGVSKIDPANPSSEYFSKGTWISSVLDLGENCKRINKLNVSDIIWLDSAGVPKLDNEGNPIPKYRYYTSTSSDGLSFSPYESVSTSIDSLGKTVSPDGRYVRIKIEFINTPTELIKYLYKDSFDEAYIEESDNQFIMLSDIQETVNPNKVYTLKSDGLYKRLVEVISLDTKNDYVEKAFAVGYALAIDHNLLKKLENRTSIDIMDENVTPSYGVGATLTPLSTYTVK